MGRGTFIAAWRTVIRRRGRTVAVAAFLLMAAWLAVSLRARRWEPRYRGRPASYWHAAFKAAFAGGKDQAPSYPQQSRLTRLKVSFGLRHADEDLMHLVGSHDPAAVPVLVGLLQDQNPNVRWYVAWRLGEMGPDATAAVPALIAASEDPHPAVRAHAADALGSIGPGARQAVPMLMRLLGDADNEVRTKAIYALGKVGPQAREAVPALMALLPSKDPNVRGHAAHALGGIGPEAKQAVPFLLALLSDAEMSVRNSAYYALEKNDPRALAEAMPGK